MTITKLDIPSTPRVCAATACIYMIEGEGRCDDPRNNRGNSDAVCHGVLPATVLTWLTRGDIGESNG